MKTLRLIGKIGLVCVAVFAFSSTTTSCKKKFKDCKCTYTNLATGTSSVAVVETKQKCWELDISIPGAYETECVKK